jgi:type II secretory pathway component PulF
MKSRELEAFYAQLEQITASGLPLHSGLQLLARERGDTGAAARAALSSLEAGGTLSEGLAAVPGLVPALHRRLLAAGERAGRLPAMLRRAQAVERDARRLRREIVSPLLYPGFLLVAAVLLPPLPRLLTEGVAGYAGAVLPPALLAAGLAAAALVASRTGALGAISGRIPIVSRVRRHLAASRFLHVLGSALESGLGVPEALEIAGPCAAEPALELRAASCRRRALEGRFRIEELAEERHFGSLGRQALLAGALTGDLASAALRSSGLLRDQAVESAQRLARVAGVLAFLLAAGAAAAQVVGLSARLYGSVAM